MILRAAGQTSVIVGLLYIVALLLFGIPQSVVEAYIQAHRWVGVLFLAGTFFGCLFLVEQHIFWSKSAYHDKVDKHLKRLTEKEAKAEAKRQFKAGKRNPPPDESA